MLASSCLFQLWLVLATIITTSTAERPTNELKAYQIPPAITRGSSFNIKVRTPHAPWQTLETYRIELHEINTTTGSAAKMPSSMAYFDFSGTVEVSVEYKTSKAETVRIRPDSYGLLPQLKGNSTIFKLTEPRKLVIQFNGQTFDCLHLFANPVETDVPSPDDPDVIYYGPGIYNATTTGNIVKVASGKTLYLAGGAILTAGIDFTNSTNATIRGRGVLYKPTTPITVHLAENITIEGITLVNTGIHVAMSSGVSVLNIRSFTGIQWGDGMDFYCSKNILVEGVFMRNSDDCIAIYNHRDNWTGDSSNIKIQNSALWADVAHPINIGTHGNTPNPETISDVTIRNIDILDHRETQVLYQGCIAINPGDDNLVKDVLIEDIRVEDFRKGQLVNMRVMFNNKYNTSPGRGISNVIIRNLSYKGSGALMSIFSGYDESRLIENITFQNLSINGLVIHDKMRKPSWYLTTDFFPAFANEHVKNLTFIA